MSRLRAYNLLLLGALLLFALWAYPQLPERIPTHFGIAGVPDAWSRKTLFTWFLLPAIAVLTTLLMQFVSRLIARRPEYVNMPAKRKFLELSRPEQQPILDLMQVFVHRMNLVMLFVFGAIQWGSWRAARGLPSVTALQAVLLLTIVVLPALTIVLLRQTTSAINEAHRRATMRGTIRTLVVLLALVLGACAPGPHEPALSAIPPWVGAASKQGAVNRSRSEVLLVESPSGPYVLAVLTKDQQDESWGADNAGYVLLRKVSGEVYRHFDPGSR